MNKKTKSVNETYFMIYNYLMNSYYYLKKVKKIILKLTIKVNRYRKILAGL